MMPDHLPNAEKAVVPETKLVRYLLNILHPKGKSKARFFLRFGFTPEAWQEFAAALKDHARTQPLTEVDTADEFGTRYAVEGVITTPDGRNPAIRVIWFIDKDDESRTPRLVTAYPLEDSDD